LLGHFAECLWSINYDLPTIQALYIDPSGPKNLLGFVLPQKGDIVKVYTDVEVLFACPGGTLGSTGEESALLTCVGGKSFAVSKLGNRLIR
jgi:hypothetical protein